MARSSRSAAIVVVGSELLIHGRRDANGPYLAEDLDKLGFLIHSITAVPDSKAAIGRRVDELLDQDVKIVFVCGGLGPTVDDVTRQGVALALGRKCELDRAMLSEMGERFTARGLLLQKEDESQVHLIQGGRWLKNDIGTAPGQAVKAGSTTVYLIPGPPHELRHMYQTYVRTKIESSTASHSMPRIHFGTAGLREARLATMLEPIIAKYSGISISFLPSYRTVEVTLLAEGGSRKELQTAASDVRSTLGSHVYSEDQRTLAEVMGALLAGREETLAVAESCTGGLVGKFITDIPGSSDYFRGGVIAYDNPAKRDLLGVSESTLAAAGAVSDAVAREMAEGIRLRLDASWGLSITGIAGPGGGTQKKPVGLTYIGLANEGKASQATRFLFSGDRDTIRRCGTHMALDFLRRSLISQI